MDELNGDEGVSMDELNGDEANWCPDCGQPREVCAANCGQCDDWFDPDDDNYCMTCGGEGWIITCIDDMCHGQDQCIHGDGEEKCPDCDNW